MSSVISQTSENLAFLSSHFNLFLSFIETGIESKRFAQ